MILNVFVDVKPQFNIGKIQCRFIEYKHFHGKFKFDYGEYPTVEIDNVYTNSGYWCTVCRIISALATAYEITPPIPIKVDDTMEDRVMRFLFVASTIDEHSSNSSAIYMSLIMKFFNAVVENIAYTYLPQYMGILSDIFYEYYRMPIDRFNIFRGSEGTIYCISEDFVTHETGFIKGQTIANEVLIGKPTFETFTFYTGNDKCGNIVFDILKWMLDNSDAKFDKDFYSVWLSIKNAYNLKQEKILVKLQERYCKPQE